MEKIKAVTIILSGDNESNVRTLEELTEFLMNELENANIGALLKIQEIDV